MDLLLGIAAVIIYAGILGLLAWDTWDQIKRQKRR